MMWTVTYRDRGGRLAEIVIDAVDRKGCFVQMRQRGIVPLSVKEGTRKKPVSTVRQTRLPRVILGSLAGCVVILGVAVAWHFLSAPEPVRKSESAVVPKVAKKVVAPSAHPSETNAVPAVQKVPVTGPEEAPSITPQPAEAEQPKSEELADGAVKIRNAKGETAILRTKRKPVNRMFKHRLENSLLWVAQPGLDVPPMPPMRFSQEEIEAALAEPVNFDMNNDSDEVIAKKQSVQEAKELLRTWLAEGKTVQSFLDELSRRQAREAAQVKESKHLIRETLEKGNVQEAEELAKALNKHLADQGIPRVVIPRAWKEAALKIQQNQSGNNP